MGSLAILNLMNDFVTFSFGISDDVTKLPGFGHGTEECQVKMSKEKPHFFLTNG